MLASRLLLAVLALALAGIAFGDERQDDEPGIRTVLGPRNPPLHDGAQELLDGNAEEGIRLTLIGLERAVGARERRAALSNLCAGHLMLKQYDTALEWCDRAIEDNQNNWRAFSNRALVNVYTGRFDEARADLERGEAIAPNARHLKEVRSILLDATDPVVPNIVIDDRRDADDSEAEDEG